MKMGTLYRIKSSIIDFDACSSLIKFFTNGNQKERKCQIREL